MRMTLAGVLVVVQMAVTSVLAQPLAERVPADALIYVGWRGVDSLGPGYDGSHLQAVLEACRSDGVLDQFVPQLIERLAQEDSDTAARVALVADLGRLLWRYPTALYVGALDLAGEAAPAPRIGFICQAGGAADELAAKLNRLVEEEGPPVPIQVKRYADRLVVTLGAEMSVLHDLANDPGAAASLADDDAFKAALAQAHRDPAVIAYVDIEGLLEQASEVMVVVNPMVAMFWPQISQALGAESLERAVWTAGFDGADWGQRLFVQAPAPRTGMMAMMAPDPVTDDIFRVVPQGAAMATVGRADLSGFLAHVRTALGEINPAFPEQFDAARQHVTAMLGVDLDAELFQALGPQWAVYTDRNTAGTGILGLVLVNPLRDPEAVERSLATLGQVATTLIAQKMQAEQITIAVRQTRVGDMAIHYLATPAVAPAWGIRDGNLYVALYPQVVSAAADHVAARAPNLLTNPSFRALRKRLGDVPANSISFVDLPQTAPQGYQTTMLMSRLYLGMADMFGVPSPPLLPPPLPKLMPHIGPAGGVTWVDDQGYHAHAISPFPGSGVLCTQNDLAISQAAMLTGVMLPAVSAARSSAQEAAGLSHLKQISIAAIVYAHEHRDAYPPHLGAALPYTNNAAAVFIHPSAKARPPAGFAQMTEQEQSDWVNEHTSYLYFVAGRKASEGNPSMDIIACAKPRFARQGRIGVAFADGHCETVPVGRVHAMVQQQTGKSLEQWGEIAPKPEAR